MTRSKRFDTLLLAAILVLVFLCSFTVLQRTQEFAPNIYGLEGYYHMAMAQLIRHGEMPREFPWLKYSILHTGFADLHLLHHLALAPFAGPSDPDLLERRAKTAASLFGAVLLTMFCFVLHRFRCRWVLIWTATLVCGAGGFFVRLAQPRPEIISLLLLLVAALLFSRRRRNHWPHLVLGLLYTLTGPTPQLLTGLALLFLFGRRLAGDRHLDLQMPLYTMAGTAAGFLVHPDRWDFFWLVGRLNWRDLLAGLVSGSGVPSNIQPIDDKPPGLDELLLHNELVVLPLMLLLVILLVSKRRQVTTFTGETISCLLCSMGFLGLTLVAARHTPHWAVFTTLFSALLLRDLRGGEDIVSPPYRQRIKYLLPLTILLVCSSVRTHDFLSDRLRSESAKANWQEIRQVSAILNNEAEAGAVVFNTRGSHFPQLFYHAPQQHYLAGLDPMLMLAHSDQYFNIWQSLRSGKYPDPYPFIRGLFDSHFLLVAKNQDRLLRRLGRDPRLMERHQGKSLVLFDLGDDDLGFITDWQMAPFSNPDPDLQPPFMAYHQPPPPGGIPIGFVDFRPFFPLGEMAPRAAQAVTTLTLNRSIDDAEIRFGANGPFRLERNGELLLESDDTNRMALIDQWCCPVKLKAGENVLRVITARSSRDWGFFLRVVDASGRPIDFDRP